MKNLLKFGNGVGCNTKMWMLRRNGLSVAYPTITAINRLVFVNYSGAITQSTSPCLILTNTSQLQQPIMTLANNIATGKCESDVWPLFTAFPICLSLFLYQRYDIAAWARPIVEGGHRRHGVQVNSLSGYDEAIHNICFHHHPLKKGAKQLFVM